MAERGGAVVGCVRPLALIADDEPQVRRLVADILTEIGFQTVTASDGVELVELADRHRPTLIVVDVMMPRMDGYTALARLRGRQATAEIPAIVLTGRVDRTYELLSQGMGVAAHVTKPFSALELAEAARRVVPEVGA